MFSQPLKTLTEIGFRLVLVTTLTIPLLILITPTAQADTEVGGPIISDTTWTVESSPYIVVQNVEVWEGVTLTIEPGVTVKFDPGTKLQVNGELIARGISGTAGGVITFTSNQTDPAPGDWGDIEFTSTAITTTMDAEGNYISGSILQYCVVEYAGYDAGSAIDAHSLLIDHCTVQDNDARGIYDLGTETAPGRITNNTISGNSANYSGGGIYTSYSTVSGNTVSGNLANHSGGGIYASYSTVSGNTVSGNSAEYYSSGGIYASYSTVSSNTVSGNSSKEDGGGIYTQRSTVSGNTVSSNSARYGGGIYASYDSTVSGNTVSGNSAGSGGGIYASYSTVSGNTVSVNTVSGNLGSGSGGGIYARSNSTVSGNTVSGNSANRNGGGIYASDSTVLTNTIAANDISGTGARGAGVHISGSDDFLYNTVVGNSGPAGSIVGGLEISGVPQVHYNNFYGNEPYDVTVVSSGDISGTHNYWGTVNSVDILNQVYDWYDDSSRGKFLYVPYLQEPSEDAPFPPPTGLTADFQDNSAILSWNAHPSFTTGWGYKVYYDTDSSVPPYEGTGLNEGDAPIDVGDQTTYTLTGLDPSKDYYFAVTAYDNEGHESWYSNVEWKQGGYWVYLPVVLRQ